VRAFWRRRSKRRYNSVIGELQARDRDLSTSGFFLLLAGGVLAGVLIVALGLAVLKLAGHGPSGTKELTAQLTPAPNENVIRCESDPIDLEEGTKTIVNFNAPELDGYDLTKVQLNTAKVNTPVDALKATIDGTLSTLLQTNESAELEDEPATFQLRATFNDGDAEIVSICTVRVLPVVAEVAGVSETATMSPEITATPRPTPRPRVVEARLIAPTATSTPLPPATLPPVTLGPSPPKQPTVVGGGPAPTNTPKPTRTPPPTATRTQVPPTATSVPPTATSVPPTSTQVPPTATPLPPTATAVPPTTGPTVAPTEVPTVAPTVDTTPTGSGVLDGLLGILGGLF
jgi:hypothetical protein